MNPKSDPNKPRFYQERNFVHEGENTGYDAKDGMNYVVN